MGSCSRGRAWDHSFGGAALERGSDPVTLNPHSLLVAGKGQSGGYVVAARKRFIWKASKPKKMELQISSGLLAVAGCPGLCKPEEELLIRKSYDSCV
jgi:hypothetical protein